LAKTLVKNNWEFFWTKLWNGALAFLRIDRDQAAKNAQKKAAKCFHLTAENLYFSF
jgi:hypothetical protein